MRFARGNTKTLDDSLNFCSSRIRESSVFYLTVVKALLKKDWKDNVGWDFGVFWKASFLRLLLMNFCILFLIYVTNHLQNSKKVSFFFNYLNYSLYCNLAKRAAWSLRQLLQARFTNRVMSAWLENDISDVTVAKSAVAIIALGVTPFLLGLYGI